MANNNKAGQARRNAGVVLTRPMAKSMSQVIASANTQTSKKDQAQG